MMNGWGFGSGMGWGVGGWILAILILAGLILGGYFLVRRRTGNSEKDGLSGAAQSALELSKTRYAAGEISREEFLKLKSDLENLENNGL